MISHHTYRCMAIDPSVQIARSVIVMMVVIGR